MLAALSLGGCMKIYPDPELPDLEVTWSTPFFGDACDEGTEVVITVTGIDDPMKRMERIAACTAENVTFADIARERYRVEGVLRKIDGPMLGMFEATEADLRNGWDTEAYLFLPFNDGSFTVAWTFDTGTCESLGVTSIILEFADPFAPEPIILDVPCEQSPLFGNAPLGEYELVVYAQAGIDTVAVSEPRPVSLLASATVHLGTIVLMSCGGPCS